MTVENNTNTNHNICKRFRGYLPVVVDVETGGFEPKTDALLEIAISIITFDVAGKAIASEVYSHHIIPFDGANLEKSALEFNKIDPYHPFRFAVTEKEALVDLFGIIKKVIKAEKCQRAVLVGHNAAFDLSFLKAAVERCKFKKMPFHRFTTFDTASLSALAYGQTVLAKAAHAAGIDFDTKEAHSARYDTERTAELFCQIINHWDHLNNN